MTSATPAHEVYQHGHHASVVSNHAKRTADKDAAFFLPMLRPGMRLLDVGCGPGSITAGLAKRVAPGETIGIDASQSVIDTARSLRDPALGSLTFEVGSIYEPRFAAGELRCRVRASGAAAPAPARRCARADAQPAEARRRGRRARRRLGQHDVLSRERGHAPLSRHVLRAGASQRRRAERRPPHAPLVPRGRLRRDAVTTSTTSYTDADATRDWANTYAERTLHSNLADKALEYGIATRAELESMAAAWRAWGDDPDALYCFSHTEVVAWKR